MENVKNILVDLIGEWTPISEGQHFSGIDFQWLASAAVVCIIFLGLFGILRSGMRR